MNSASDFVGKPIVTQSGTLVNTIDDVVFDPQTHYVLCFIIEPGGWGGGAKILPWSDDYSITANALTISSPEQIVLAREVPHIQEILENIQVVVGKKIVVPDGRQIGTLNDVHFDENTGEIFEYEIRGDLQITSSERHILLQPDEVEFEMRRGTALLVSATTADLIEQHIRTE